jgi:translation initiation factor 2 subunit 2
MEMDPDVLQFALDLKSQKKKKRIKLAPVLEAAAEEEECQLNYINLLERTFATLRQDRPQCPDVPLPVIGHFGRKTIWFNFTKAYLSLDRESEHLKSYILAELGTQGSLDSEEHLILKGKWKTAHIESLLAKYCLEYVQCKQIKCNSLSTRLDRDSATHLQFIECKSCSARRFVLPGIKRGFHAPTGADRKNARRADT